MTPSRGADAAGPLNGRLGIFVFLLGEIFMRGWGIFLGGRTVVGFFEIWMEGGFWEKIEGCFDFFVFWGSSSKLLSMIAAEARRVQVDGFGFLPSDPRQIVRRYIGVYNNHRFETMNWIFKVKMIFYYKIIVWCFNAFLILTWKNVVCKIRGII